MKPSVKLTPQKRQVLIDGSWQIQSLKLVEHPLSQVLKQIQNEKTAEKPVTFDIMGSTLLDHAGAQTLDR